MSKESDQEKTEPATPKKREEARKKGQVAKSRELPSALVLMGGVGFLGVFGGSVVDSFMAMYSHLIQKCGHSALGNGGLLGLGWESFEMALLAGGPMLAVLLFIVLVSHVLQYGVLFSSEAIKPDANRLNPVEGFKKLFSIRSLVETVKSILKLGVVAYVAWRTVEAEWFNIFPLAGSSPWKVASYMGEVVVRIGFRTAAVLLFLGVIDYLYQRWEHERSLKMTKQEVKEEYKQREGNPRMKGWMRHKHREMARKRMMADVPKADVVVTNPARLAVAIRYERGEMEAPLVVAKGSGFIAKRIREIARESGVPVLEDKPLARALFRTVEVGQEIPVDLYRAVAQILAHVYRMKGAA